MKLTLEETYLLERAKTQGSVTSDVRDNYDAVTEAYRDWCQAERLPFLHIALGNATSRLIYSLIETDTHFTAETEERLRQQLPTYCLFKGEFEIDDDYLIAGRVKNALLPAFRKCLNDLLNEMIERLHSVG